MKKVLFSAVVFILSIFISVNSFADDGGSYYPSEWSYGNIYVKEPNEKISLENEVLEFNYNKATAYFDFNNTTAEKVKVPCSFPVVIKVPFAIKNNEVILKYNYSVKTSQTPFVIALSKSIYDKYQTIPVEELKAKDKTLRVLSYQDYLKEFNLLPDEEYSGCKIFQDGKEIKIQNVGIEVNLELDSDSIFTDDYYWDDNYSYLTLVLHYFHELEFYPSKRSEVTVSYRVESDRKHYHGMKYEAFYDISTGGTWKGSMNRFLVISEMDMQINNGSTKPSSIVDCNNTNFYLFQNYKPNKNEYFVFNYSLDAEDGGYRPPLTSDFKKQNFVKNINASSFLPGTFTYFDMKDISVIWNSKSDRSQKKSGYSAETSFDCDPYNGWVEGAKGDGIGEWVEFTLTKKVLGPFATNGLTKYPADFDYSKESMDDGKYAFDTWLENNRIKSMSLTGNKGLKTTLNFKDIYSGFRSSYDNFNIYDYNAIEDPVILEPDTYTMTIESVYKGSKYDDTVLGEVWFKEIPDILSGLIDYDRTRNSSFFEKIIIDYYKRMLLQFDQSEYFKKKFILK